MSKPPKFIEGIPHAGHLPHAIEYRPGNLHWPAKGIAMTYQRALCGVGRGGMRIRLNKDGEPRPWAGIDGCNACHVKISKLKGQK